MTDYITESFTSDNETLNAVNDILSAIGESPVSSLDTDANADVANALRILESTNKMIQSKGWTFNIVTKTLVPDTYSGMIVWSPNYLGIYATSGTSSYVNRGGYFYDNANATDVFTDSVEIALIELKDYSEMPYCFREWIVKRAARRFNQRFFGDDTLDQQLAQDEQEAEMDCKTFEIDFGNYNMFTGDTFIAGQISR